MKNIKIIAIVIIFVIGFVKFLDYTKQKEVYRKLTAEIVEVTNEENYSQEVLGQLEGPVLVVFTSDELWERKGNIPSNSSPAPLILAIQEIVRQEKYKGEVKFCKYTLPKGSHNRLTQSFDRDKLGKGYKIKWLPTVIIFKGGNILNKFEGGGCTMGDSQEKIEAALQKIIN